MLYDMLVDIAKKYPDKVAIEIGNKQLQYEKLVEQVSGFSSELVNMGVCAGDSVVLFLPNSTEFVVATFAIAKIGAIIVPLNTALEPGELGFYLQDSQPSVFISTGELIGRHQQLISEHVPECQIISDIYPERKCSTGTPGSTHVVSVDTMMLYQYSSGSTGKPKRVMRTQANLMHEANNYIKTIGLVADDRMLCTVPMSHAHGFSNCMVASLCSGATLFIVAPFNRNVVMETLLEKQISIFPAVSFMFSVLADSDSIAAVELSALRLAFVGGAPLPRKVFDSFKAKFGVELKQAYGSTETGVASINVGDTHGDLWSSVGKSLCGVDIIIAGDDGQTLPAGEIGEVVIRSAATTTGYANLEGVNKTTFRDGLFWSGDLGKLDVDGNLFITGRKKLFINVGANKVDPGEVESLVNTHPAVKECVILGVPGPYNDELVKAAVVLNPGIELKSEEIKNWLKDKMAGFKIPRIVEFREEIPRSPLGKILRKELID